MRRTPTHHAVYFALAVGSVLAVTCQSGAAVDDADIAAAAATSDRTIAIRTVGQFDNPVDAAALVSSQIAR